MKFGRIKVATPDGEQQRLVVVEPEHERVVDLARAYSLLQQRRGATESAAARVARALFPSSMAAAIAAGSVFRHAAEEALDAGDDAATSIDRVNWPPRWTPR